MNPKRRLAGPTAWLWQAARRRVEASKRLADQHMTEKAPTETGGKREGGAAAGASIETIETIETLLPRWLTHLYLALAALALTDACDGQTALPLVLGLCWGWVLALSPLCAVVERQLRKRLAKHRGTQRLGWSVGVALLVTWAAAPWELRTSGPVWLVLAALPLCTMAILSLVRAERHRAWSALPMGLALAVLAIDRRAYVGLYQTLHLALAVLAAAAAVLALRRLLPRGLGRPASVVLHLGGALLLFWACCPRIDRAAAHATLVRQRGFGHKLLRTTWSVVDMDADGSSPWFGGGDCDDSDANRSPNRRDHPEDGIDSDCSGGDRQAAPKPFPLAAPTRPLPRVPAILLVTGDSLRADVLGAYGFALRPTSPSFDRQARAGVLFRRAYSLFPSTWASLEMITMGSYGDSHRHRLAPSGPPPLGAALRAAGLAATALVPQDALASGTLASGGFTVHQLPGGPPADVQAEAALPHLARLGERGGLLWVHFFDPHAPYPSLPEYPWGGEPFSRYLAGVARWDRGLGRLLVAAGPRVGVIVSSDHGEAFGEHTGVQYHRTSLYDEQLRVPLLVRVPGLEPRVVEGTVGLIDLYPTILELLGVSPGPGLRCDGRSLVPALLGSAVPPWPYWANAFTAMPELGPPQTPLAVIVGNLKLVRYADFGVEECYNLLADPAERHPAGCGAAQPLLHDLLFGHNMEQTLRALRLLP